MLTKECDWFQDGCWTNHALTLAYGEFSKTVHDHAGDDKYPDNAVSCCWSESVLTHLGIPEREKGFKDDELNVAVFNGKCIHVIHGEHSREINNIRCSSVIRKIWDGVWNKYEKLCDDDAIISILPENYSEFIQPKVLELLEKKHGLSGGHWYLLPSGCWCCT